MASQDEEEHRGGVGASPGHGFPTHSTHTDCSGRSLGAHRQGEEGQERSNPEIPHRYRTPSEEMSGWAGPYWGGVRMYTQLGGVLGGVLRTLQMGQQDAQKEQLFSLESRRPLITDKLEALQGSRGKREDVSSSVNGTRQSCSAHSEQQARPPEGRLEHTMSRTLQSSHMGVRRTKSLDHRLMESSSTPDQLNFKKGWLSKLFDGGVWKKRWFVLTDRSLRWYRDTVAEETGDLDGEVDLSTCCDVTEFPVLRNYGFQIHTKDGTVTLSAVTSGIRRHWIQAMLKNVKTITAPDVTRKPTSVKLSGSKCSTFLEEARAVALPCPTMSGLNAHSSKAELQTQMDNQNGTEQRRRRSRIRDRRLEGRYRTFDWAEFRRELLPQKLPRPPEKARDTVDRKALPTPATTMPKEEGANRGGCGLEKDPPREEGLSSPARLQQETNLPCQQEEIKPPEDERQVTNSAKTPMSVTPDLCSPLQNALEKQRKALDSDVLQDSPSSPWIPASSGPQHRTEEQGQPRLSEASSEWALAQVKSELQLEQERSWECRQRWECAEQGLRVQLQERGECLQAVEAHLLQRGQALCDLEQQQALQHDHLNEAEQLQDRLAEVTGHLVTTEEAQAICEQRLQENLEVLQEKQERERHGLAQCLATAQGNMWQLEQRLLEVEQQAVALLSDKQPTRLEAGEAQLLLKDDAIEKLTESVRLLEAEKSQLHRRCRELAQQAVIADSKWKQLREMGSCAEKAECVQQVAWALQQKDKEIENIKEMYEKMLQRKDQDLNEAVVKMAALGSSLEETEFRLQAKEQLLRQLSCGGEASKLQVKLMSAMEQIVQLEQCQEGLRLAHADLQKVHTQLQQDYNALILHLKSFSIAETLTMWRDASCVEEMPEDHGSVHCGAPMGPGNFVSQDSCKASAGNDPAGFISLIRCLEAKLLATEEKLRDITVKLQDQQDSGTGWPSWGCGSGIETCAELGKLNNEHHQDTGKWTSSTRAVDPLCRRTQTWMGPNKKEVSAGLSHDGPVSDMEHPLLVKVGRELSSIAHNIGLGAGFWEDNWTDCEARDRNVLQENGAKRIAEMLAFEALVLSRMASSIRSQNADLFLNLSEIYQEVEKPNSNDDGDGEVDVHALALKLRVESEFWIEVEKLKMCQDGAESTEGSFIESPCVKANLDYAVQNLKLLYKVKFQRLQEDAVNMRKNSPSRDWTLRGKGEAAKSPAVDLIPEDIQKEPACYLENPRMNRPGDLPSYSTTMESLRLSQDTLASELEAQAVFLQRLSREVGMSLEWKSSGLHLWLEAVYRTNSCYSKVSDTWDHTHCLQEAMVQAQVAYVVCRLRAEHKNSLQLCRDAASLQAENKHLRKELLQLQQHLSQLEQTETRQKAEALQVEQRRAPTELALVEEAAENKRKLELVLIEMEKMEDRHEEHIQKLEETFQRRLRELGSSHEEESPHCRAPPKHASIQLTDLVALRKRIRELEAQVKVMKKELGNKQLEKSIFCLKEEYQQDLEHLKVTCQLGFAAMEDAHQKAMEELHKRHQTETAKLQEERDRLLAEETAATIAAIEAMKKAHHEELKKVQRAQLSRKSDADELGCHYEEELKSVHRELDVLSQQYSHKCLESTHLAQALEAERLALRRCQRENRELNAHNQELNRQLREEISRIRSGPPAIGAGPSGTRSSERYEMEVLLHVKEAELQCLKQELCSLQDELQALLRIRHAARPDRSQSAERGAGDKHSSQLSVTKAQEEHLAAVMEARGVKCESSTGSQRKERNQSARSSRGVRSKSLKEGLTPQECTRLFEDADSRKI